MAFSGFLFSAVIRFYNMPWLALVAALAGGALVGYLNGLMVARIGVPSIMATLAAQFFWDGMTTLLAGGCSGNIRDFENNVVHTILVGRSFGIIPMQAFWSAGLAVLLWFILNRHEFGEAIMFIGDNAERGPCHGDQRRSHQDQALYHERAHRRICRGPLDQRDGHVLADSGRRLPVPVMATVFVGGTSIAGGEGSIVGTFFGAYVIGSLEAGVVATGIGGYWTRLVEGLVMAASVVLT